MICGYVSEQGKLFRDLFEDETQREVVIESLQADCEVRTGTPLELSFFTILLGIRFVIEAEWSEEFWGKLFWQQII